jgi:transposase InsO family protein
LAFERCLSAANLVTAKQSEEGKQNASGACWRADDEVVQQQKKEVAVKKTNKAAHARALGVARSTLYYKPRLPDKDWKLKCEIEKVLRTHPSYGHRRLAIELRVNKKRILRVMKKFGIKPYRRRGKKWKNITKPRNRIKYPNLLLEQSPAYPHHIWATDFTYIWFQEKWLYVCTMMDLFTRKIVGFSVLNNHSVQLVINAFFSAINKHPKPKNESPRSKLRGIYGYCVAVYKSLSCSL